MGSLVLGAHEQSPGFSTHWVMGEMALRSAKSPPAFCETHVLDEKTLMQSFSPLIVHQRRAGAAAEIVGFS